MTTQTRGKWTVEPTGSPLPVRDLDYSSAILEEDAEEKGWAECQDCEEWFCPEHHVMEKGGRYEVCLECRNQQEIDAVSPRFED